MKDFPHAVVAAALLSAALASAAAAQTPAVTIDADTISGLGARNIGSAAMSGRVAALDAIREGQRLTVFVGAASGGVWKSVNGGTTYKPVFDKQPVQSIGAVTIDPKNPKVVWVGTGEAWTRNSVSIGDGIYKSVDGGDNWQSMGLRETERIVKILVDPNASDTVYACAPGKLWSDSDERGVYKTTDGGKTWTKSPQGRKSVDRMLHDLDGPAEPVDALRRHVGLPAQGLDVPLGRRGPRGNERERTLQVDRRRSDLDVARRDGRQGPPAETLGTRRGDGRARRSRASSTRSSRPWCPGTASTVRTTAERRGRPRTAARTWSGGPSTSPI